MARIIKEADLYPKIEKWAKKHFKCFEAITNIGLKYSRADVFCVRDTGGALTSEYETIAMEVKKAAGPFATASGQAYGYRVYANRVYLAEYRREPFSDAQRRIATEVGIGLIQVHSGGRCTEIQMSPRYEPLPSMASELLEKTRYGMCRICGILFRVGPPGKGMNHTWVARQKIKKAATDEKGLMFWHYELGKRKKRVRLGKYGSTWAKYDTVERRFICSDCIANLWGPFIDDGRSRTT